MTAIWILAVPTFCCCCFRSSSRLVCYCRGFAFDTRRKPFHLLCCAPDHPPVSLTHTSLFRSSSTLPSSQDKSNLISDFPWQFRLVAKIRTPILVFIVVPMSFTLWCYRQLKLKFRRIMNGKQVASFNGHEERCNQVIAQIKQWNKDGRKQKLRTARPNWASMSTKLSSNKENCQLINMSHMNHMQFPTLPCKIMTQMKSLRYAFLNSCICNCTFSFLRDFNILFNFYKSITKGFLTG